MKYPYVLLLIPLMLPFSGCSTLATGGAELSGLSLLHDRRSSEALLLDERIELSIASRIRDDIELYPHTHVNVTSYNATVLLTGEAADEAARTRVVDIARTTAGVKKVQNFLDTGPNSSLATRAKDTLLSGKIKSAIAEVKHIPGFDATRIKVVSEKGVVYLMGLVHRNEANIATEMARRTQGVGKVVTVFEYLE
ncbi:MAG: BON domain-containing protein [Gammaproteobacteria bacterium]